MLSRNKCSTRTVSCSLFSKELIHAEGKTRQLSSQQLFSTLLASEVRGELLVLFHRNPGLIDNLDGVARRIGRTAALIEQDVRALVEVGVLIQKKIGNSEVIRLDRQKDREILDSVANQIRNIDVGGEK
jgi:hypothetical protein